MVRAAGQMRALPDVNPRDVELSHGIRVTLRPSRDPDIAFSTVTRRLTEAGVHARVTRV
jgi:hypothetical protein